MVDDLVTLAWKKFGSRSPEDPMLPYLLGSSLTYDDCKHLAHEVAKIEDDKTLLETLRKIPNYIVARLPNTEPTLLSRATKAVQASCACGGRECPKQ